MIETQYIIIVKKGIHSDKSHGSQADQMHIIDNVKELQPIISVNEDLLTNLTASNQQKSRS